MKACLATLVSLLLAATSPAEARRFARPEPPAVATSVEHAFDGASAFRLELEPIRGDLRQLQGPNPRLLDFADYMKAGRLEVFREIALGPLASGAAFVGPGLYELSLSVSGPEGLPVLGLASADGLRLRLPLIAAPRPKRPPEGLSVVSLAHGDAVHVSLPVAIHLPTVSGLLVLAPVETLLESPLARRRSRTAVIEEELARRALESGHVRSLKRRDSR